MEVGVLLSDDQLAFNPSIPYSDLKIGRRLGYGQDRNEFNVSWYHNHKIAVKVLKECENEIHQTYVDREISIQKMLHHPNCLKLYGTSLTDTNQVALIMELAGKNMKACLFGADRIVLTNEEKKQILLQIAHAIAYLHSKSIIHRDLKLENILMINKKPLLSDFGLSRELREMAALIVTQVGSPITMAPELIAHEPVTNLVDVYSFGCIMNEIVGGKQCWSDYKYTTHKQFYNDVMNGKRPTIPETIPSEVGSLIRECFQTKEKRPSMDEVIAKIEAWNPALW
ncbi:TKL protein kinase [Blastocystis sp. subtype 4]|uniref:TKL protein kinase n=1 Tax=Blastocystis sp. subtype 4 TaxID=944170 RepID=UPI00071184FC|nr:TKL protein kinase [Blastocystis sp. subtype 4]KNB44898.1 TKL protein kinase [Blastocystis sp. subtype 4]|eukprot:XP_014528341.1 TKL protein kinase [Blastocystis sp. subtype 4]